jgi:TrmH family RNA methyltransferase
VSTSAIFKSVISRDNPLLKDLRNLSTDNTAYRKLGRFWIEGEHLAQAALARGAAPLTAVFSESFWGEAPPSMTQAATQNVVVPDKLFNEISGLESAAAMGFLFELPTAQPIQRHVASVILDRVQDAGNVGSILRSAAAFGFQQVLALKGTAGLWSPKVLRAGMGSHFGLQLIEGLDLSALEPLTVPLLVTSSHLGEPIQHLQLPKPCAWVMGHEGQGICAELMARASLKVRIAQPGGEESLNVAAAAAICLHASSLKASV